MLMLSGLACDDETKEDNDSWVVYSHDDHVVDVDDGVHISWLMKVRLQMVESRTHEPNHLEHIGNLLEHRIQVMSRVASANTRAKSQMYKQLHCCCVSWVKRHVDSLVVYLHNLVNGCMLMMVVHVSILSKQQTRAAISNFYNHVTIVPYLFVQLDLPSNCKASV
jgi:hypothetical protein